MQKPLEIALYICSIDELLKARRWEEFSLCLAFGA
jgi:hypothetical protein